MRHISYTLALAAAAMIVVILTMAILDKAMPPIEATEIYQNADGAITGSTTYHYPPPAVVSTCIGMMVNFSIQGKYCHDVEAEEIIDYRFISKTGEVRNMTRDEFHDLIFPENISQ